MVRRLAIAGSITLLTALLGACGFFLASPFPQHLAQVTHQLSVSEYLEDPTSGQVTMKVMNNGSLELLFLVHHPTVENSRLLVLDERLGIVSRYEDDRSVSTNRLGNLLMVRTAAAGFVCGTVLFDAAGDFTGTSPSTDLSSRIGNLGFDAATEYRLFDWSIRTTSNNEKLDSSFFLAGTDGGVFLNSTGASYVLREIFHDVPDDRVAFYFRQEGTWRIEGVLYQASAFATYPYSPFLDNNPTHFTIDNVDPAYVHYTRDGTVIRTMEEDGGRRKLQLIGFDGRVKAEFSDYENRTVDAYAAEGDHYYFLDLEQAILYRANTWW
jgi:hypothetical protein